MIDNFLHGGNLRLPILECLVFIIGHPSNELPKALIDCADEHSADLVYDLLVRLKTLVTKSDDLIAAIDGTTDQFEPEVAALNNAASSAEKAFRPKKGGL